MIQLTASANLRRIEEVVAERTETAKRRGHAPFMVVGVQFRITLSVDGVPELYALEERDAEARGHRAIVNWLETFLHGYRTAGR